MKINDRKLIEAVRQHKELYNASHVQYGDLEHKKEVWEKIGATLHQSAAACKIRWNNIRDNFRKSLRKRQNEKEYFLSSKGSAHRQYKYEHLLKFLAPAYQTRDPEKKPDEIHTYSAKVAVERHDDETNDTEDNSLQDMETMSYEGDETVIANLEVLENRFLRNVDEESDEEENQPVAPRFPTRKDDELIHKFSRTSFKMIEHFIAQENRRQNPHHIDAFLNGIAPTLKSFTPYYQNLVKTKIFAVVQQIELEMIPSSEIKQEVEDIEEADSPGMSSIDQEHEIATTNPLE